jgi:hypothetical protein
MATRTSSQSGNWSDSSTWGGNTPPGDGDIAVIATGHTVTVTANVTVGSNSSNVGNAITINGTNSSTFGKLIVNDAVTLTLKGNDNGSNKAMSIARYAQFEPQPGAIIEVDATADYETTIVNSGIINAIGTLAKPITFRATAASANWNNSNGPTTYSGASYEWDGEAKIAIRKLPGWISNAAGTGPGSYGDSSVSISSQSPGTICATEVAIGTPTDPAVNVTSAGKYAIDYDTGAIYFYHNYAAATPQIVLAWSIANSGTDVGSTRSQMRDGWPTFIEDYVRPGIEWARSKYGDFIGGDQQSWGRWNKQNGKPEGVAKMATGMFFARARAIAGMLHGDDYAICGVAGWDREPSPFEKSTLLEHMRSSTVQDYYKARQERNHEIAEQAMAGEFLAA